MVRIREEDLKRLYQMQKALDQEIAKRHYATYERTRQKRLLALIVEFCELANATRTFKYWSVQGPKEQSVLLEEYVDGLHFLLSLGLSYDLTITKFPDLAASEWLSETFLALIEAALAFGREPNQDSYSTLFAQFLSLGLDCLNFTWELIVDSYVAKNRVNYQRQEENY